MRLLRHPAALAAAIAAAALLAAPALAETAPAETAPPAVISVTGEATVSVAPDQAQIDGGVTSEAKTAREASDANNAAMGKVLLALKGAGSSAPTAMARAAGCLKNLTSAARRR